MLVSLHRYSNNTLNDFVGIFFSQKCMYLRIFHLLKSYPGHTSSKKTLGFLLLLLFQSTRTYESLTLESFLVEFGGPDVVLGT